LVLTAIFISAIIIILLHARREGSDALVRGAHPRVVFLVTVGAIPCFHIIIGIAVPMAQSVVPKRIGLLEEGRMGLVGLGTRFGTENGVVLFKITVLIVGVGINTIVIDRSIRHFIDKILF
jgi:hypothetical protein